MTAWEFMTRKLPLLDKPNINEVKSDTFEQRRCSTTCSQEAQDLMRSNPQQGMRQPDADQTRRYPPPLSVTDASSQTTRPADNAALKQQTDILFNPNASAEQKLATVQGLYDAGLKQLSYRDQSGEHQLQLEKITVGESGRSMVHLFGTDGNGQQHTILRGIAQADGKFGNEKDQQGQAVDFYGRGKGLLDQANSPDVSIPNRNLDGQNPQNPNGDVRNQRAPNADPNALYCPSPYDTRPGVDNRQNQNDGLRAGQNGMDSEAWRRSNPFDKNYDPSGDKSRQPLDGNTQPDNRVRPPLDQYRQPDNQYSQPDNQRRQPDYQYGPPDQQYGQPDNQNRPPLHDNSQRFDRHHRPDVRPNPNDQDGSNNNLDQGQGRNRPNPYVRPPSDQTPYERNDAPPRPYSGGDTTGNAVRDTADRNAFYAHQNDAYSCSAFSMAMMGSDWNTGHPPSNAESSNWKHIAGTIGQGYRGSLRTVASNLQEGIPGLHTKVYDYGMGKVGPSAMSDLNQELAQGHTAVAKVINPHTGNAHYIYIAGRSQNGEYLLGDPDRKNPHQQPISGARLLHMMSPRDGFVAGWKDSPSAASRTQGSAAYHYAMTHRQGYES
jgi:hypothetical protein